MTRSTRHSLALSLVALSPALFASAALVHADDDENKSLVFDAAPADWKADEIKGGMMGMAPKLQFSLPAAEGDAEPAKITLHHLGSFAGSVDDNIKRWCGQFKTADGAALDPAKVERQKLDVGDLKVTVIELAGTYNQPFGKPAIANARMIAAIVETPAGPHFVKLWGAEKTVVKHREAFMKWLKSAKWADAAATGKKTDEKKDEPTKPDPKKDDEKKPEGK